MILREQATIFDSLIKQIETYRELKDILQAILFQGSKLAYNPDQAAISLGVMFGYLKDNSGNVAVSNRIFEMRLYNYFLSENQLTSESYQEAQKDKNQFVRTRNYVKGWYPFLGKGNSSEREKSKMTEQERLAAYEKMQQGIQQEFANITRQLETLKEQGKVKSATYKQLMGRKLTYSAFLNLYKVYGLEE